MFMGRTKQVFPLGTQRGAPTPEDFFQLDAEDTSVGVGLFLVVVFAVGIMAS